MFLNIDLRTVILLLGITNFIQVIALLLQYTINKSYRGGIWWLLGFTSIALGLVLTLLRDVIDIKLITITAANTFQILGPIFIYFGVMRFLIKEENRGFIIWVFVVWLPLSLYFTFVDDQINLRSIISSVALATIAFMTARGLFLHNISAIHASAKFNMALFFAQACFWIFRTIELLTFSPVHDYFSPTLIQTVTYIFVFIISLFETFGLIIMVNQRLNTEMKEAKNHFEAIFNTSPDAVMISRLNDGVIVDANEGFTAMTGYTHAEVIGKSSLDVNIWFDPADRQRLITFLNDKGFTVDLEAVFQRKNGSQLTGILSAKVIELNGESHIVSVTRDITGRKAAEEALKESQSLYLAVIEDQTDPVCRWLPDTTLTFVNSAYCKYFGKSKEELLGTRFISILPQETQNDIRKTIDSLLRREVSIINKEELNFDGYGNPRWMVWAYRPITGKNSEIIDFQSVGRDITERKKAEDELRKSESKMRAITDSAQDAILMMDPTGHVTYWNPAAERILGYTSAEAIGQMLHHWIVPRRYLAAHNSAFPIFQKTGEGEAIGKTHEVHARRKDGTEIPVQLSLSSLEMNGEWYAVGIINDITERKRLEEKLMHQATTDELTAISNRHHFLDLALSEFKRSIRFNHPLTLLMMDLDHLKHINDTYGHASGDQALMVFAKTCKSNIRVIDIFARFGGDEFVLLLPETNCESAVEVAKRFRLTLAAQPVDCAGIPVVITMSVGVSCLNKANDTLETMLARADQALYQAKEGGRNQIVCSDENECLTID